MRTLRRRPEWPLVGWLVVVWVLLWGSVTAANVSTGLIVAVVLCLVFPLPRLGLGLRLHPVGLVRFAAHFLTDLTVSGLRTAWQSLTPAPLPCAVLAIRLRCSGDLMLAATAIAVSAVPGSAVLEMQRSTATLFVHVMDSDIEQARDGVRRLEVLVVRAFGTRAEIASLDEPYGPDEGAAT
ncbi:Na+/H+ antiporter subunit E [Streptomyces sp. H10-C2]|uniref:Na+/H+ antiporter subunit E n=1 Tax=unclassified Streptomyces TaxID=2593676 RepID=UPI0024B930B1|nr:MULTISPECIES: Na+/H+ antiporter subunit E [unclassified Streptomyces]MDJ0339976.1 Na+/H+ antiporter subunit E [Streptomyces sp. PH10-H1]MDJ0369387.1 Na+/H+ antiporter subunit E [Streptomyces sp. H10-C2]